MRIRPADSAPVEFPCGDNPQYLIVAGHYRGGQRIQIAQNTGALPEITASQFAQNKRMH